MNNIRIGYSPFLKGFLEELRKVENVRVKGHLRIIERLNLEVMRRLRGYAVKL
jgi:hypothetical protein